MVQNPFVDLLTEDHILLLRKNVIFRNFDFKKLCEIQKDSCVTVYKKGALIEASSSLPKSIHFVISGGIKRSLIKSSRREFIFDISVENHFDGFYMEWISGLPTNSNIYAIFNNTKVVSIPLEFWESFLNKHSDLKNRHTEYIFNKYQAATVRLSSHLMNRSGSSSYRQIMEQAPKLLELLTKKELGAYIGVAPETISRLLRKDRCINQKLL